MTQDRRSLGSLIWWLALGAVAVAGLFAGGAFRSVFVPRVQPEPPRLSLRAGMAFPDVDVIAPDGSHASSRGLAAGRSAVLLLDPECPPCEKMAAAWEERRRAGHASARDLVAIAEGPPLQAREFASRVGLGFPVYADSARALQHSSGIDDFPLAVWTDAHGTITGATFDAKQTSVPHAAAR